MVEVAGLYFVIANDAQARFVRSGPDFQPHTIRSLDHATLPGQAGNPARPVDFVPLLAERINDDFAVDLFSQLVLVGPPHLLPALIAALSPEAEAVLLGSLAEDLVTLPDHALWPYLRTWLPPPD